MVIPYCDKCGKGEEELTSDMKSLGVKKIEHEYGIVTWKDIWRCQDCIIKNNPLFNKK